MEVRPGYKLTEAGVIPEDWHAVPIASLTPPNRKNGIVDGPFGSNLKTIHYRTSGIPIITSGYVTDGVFRVDKYLYVDHAKFQEEKRSAVQPGDIVMAKIGERCGASAILPATHETGILSGNALKITVDESLHSTSYIWQVLWHLHVSGKLEVLRTVGAQPALSMANLKRYKMAVPPTRTEQAIIAAALSDADALLDGLDRLIAKKRDLKRATMQQLLTGQTRLPGFRGRWEINALGAVANIVMGQSPDSRHYNRVGDGVPLIQGNADIEDRRSIARVWTTQLTKEGRAGDLLLTVRAPVGAVGRVSERCCLGRGVCALRPKGDADFLFHALIFAEKDWKVLEQGSTFTAANSQQVATFSVSMPATVGEQTAIAMVLSDMDSELAALEARRDKTRDLKQAMMQELLTGRTRLVPEGAAHA